jgi:C4-dicarboxylate-specific signal transduction histidine kinase
MEQKLNERREIYSIVRGIFDLTILANEYLLYHEKRPLEQWNRRYNALASLIDSGARKAAYGAYPMSLRDDYRDVKVLFSRLISAYNNPPIQDNLELFHRLESHLQSQILTKNYELVTRTNRLEERTERELVIGQKRIGWIILGLILAVSVSVLGLAFFINKDVALPFENLIKGVESIGKGNLDARIASKSRDEIGELSRSFDQMVSRLREVMVASASLQAEVRHLDRVATMGTLTAALAHEINQPLAAILSNAQAAIRFLKNERPDYHEVREALEDIVSDDKRAGEVIQRLRMMLKKEELKREALELNGVIEEVVNLIHSEVIIINASIAMNLDAKLPPVYGDRIQIQQVVLNLLVNALDAVRGQPEENRKVRINTRLGETDSIIVSVSDSGPGIEDHNLEAIFEAFYTTKNKGMGVGLPISKSIIEQHDGRIWASNNPEGGATFAFTLQIRSQME